jgi:hemerythrin-like domain-containing protein
MCHGFDMTGNDAHTGLELEELLACIEKEHEEERNLCDMLERIADNLLEPLDTEMARTGIVTLRRCLKRHVVLEEKYLYPVLTKHLCPDDLAENLLEHIRCEHTTDESLAHDTADQLELALERGRVENPEMLGYMLRGFFECRRRHIAWEDAIVIPLARYRLSARHFRAFSLEEFEASMDQA